MKFFNGFSLTNGEKFFTDYTKIGDYTVAGFSYGAIKAVEYAHQSSHRIDTLQLFSPAFFQTHSEAFRRLQLKSYQKNPHTYTQTFLHNCFSPWDEQAVDVDNEASVDQLKELLWFMWDKILMEKIVKKGIQIEVFLGLEDRISDVQGARNFFLPYATVTSIREGNHFLQKGY